MTDLNIRRAAIGDEVAIAQVHIQSWQEAYKDLIPQEYLDQLPSKIEDRIKMWKSILINPQRWAFVAEGRKGIVGFVLFGPPRDENRGGFIELGAIYILVSEKGCGMGFALLSEGFNLMKELGYKRAYCWVLENNPTIKFYERTGAKFSGHSKEDEIGAKKFNELAYEWDSLNLEFQFRPLNEDHIPMLRKWLKEPHVAEFWQEPEDETEFKQKYLGKLQERNVRPYIFYFQGKPIGYIQDYEAALVGGGWWPQAKPGTFGVDQFIGEPNFVNKGLGTKIIHQFVAKLFESPNVIEIITDPDPKNGRAIRAYEKVGFKKVGPIVTPGGDAILMKIIRGEFLNSKLPIFKTERLFLKEVTSADIPSYEKYFVDYEVISQLSAAVPWPYPKNGVGEFLNKFLFPDQGKTQWLWGIFEKENPDTLIGVVHLWREGRPENRGFWLGKPFWGKGYMTEAVAPIMDYAFNELGFKKLVFANAFGNDKSRRIKVKTGARLIDVKPAKFVNPKYTEHEVWELTKSEWFRCRKFAEFSEQPALSTQRLALEPITEAHAQELVEFFGDTELHHFVPFEPPTLALQTDRCIKWAKRRSPDATELWLNWAARDKHSGEIVAHIQAGLKEDGVASIGYVVGRKFQRTGFATECLEALFKYLKNDLWVHEVKAWSDTRNEASHRLAKKMGMVQVELIKKADFFKGTSSDEYVFSKVFQS
jgi:RimJ/RimL family protein N-acetyltransferase